MKINRHTILIVISVFLLIAGGFGVSYAMSPQGEGNDWFSALVMLAFGLIFLVVTLKGKVK